DDDVLAARDQVLLGLGVVRPDDDLPHALDEAAHLDPAVDLRDHGLLLRLAGLEQLRHARQTTGDVLRARGFPHDLRDDVAHEDLGAVRDGELRPDRQRGPVTSSNSSRTVMPSAMSWYSTRPVNSVRIGLVNGSHSTRTVRAFTFWS